MTRILVCDDEPEKRDAWIADIQKAIGVTSNYTVGAFVEPLGAIRELLARQKAHRNGEKRLPSPCEFDDLDVMVVDFDLVVFDAANARHTGEEVARLCRLYSRVGYIIVLNQGNRSSDFDLTMVGRPKSYADLNIPAKTVKRSGLWSLASPGEFNPWDWDEIHSTIAARRALVVSVAENLNAGVIETLKIPDQVISAFSDEAYEFIDPSAADPAKLLGVTFADFLKRLSVHKDVETLIAEDSTQAAEVAVARIAKWLSRLLLGPQDILVDVPHLLQRQPSLMSSAAGDPVDANCWNKVIGRSDAIDPGVADASVFIDSPAWLGTQAYWWPLVESSEQATQLRSGFDFSKVADVVFAEDTSQFIPFTEAKEFRASFHNRFDRRYIAKLPGIEYGPTRRLVFTE